MSSGLLPLEFLDIGREAVIREVAGGLSLRRRLTDLGLVRGTTIRVIRNDNFGPVIVSLGNSSGGGRLAIGRGMAHKIMVEEAG
ncbi:FeoA family protein [Moorella sp. Hama-1]|uniref:FeoA family protein n=1 Tax=Moorella sp. Hama-1 TaxID=2138101 RepID=UPI000D65EC1D|nr:ferrous iron transport protein A [Moorella sp. Hama-1]BCV21636.1 iron transporter FeoA [Moorella sp. Hama-1]